MRTQITFSIAIAFLLFFGCTRGSYITPEIELLSIFQIGDTTIINIDVDDFGEPIFGIGVAYQIGETPLVTDNQLLYSGGNGLLSVPIIGLAQEMEYHFIVFVVNDYSYGESKSMTFFVPRRTPIEPPCELESEQIEFAGGLYTPQRATASFSDIRNVIDFSAPGLTMGFSFKEKPNTGIYKTTKSTPDFSNQIYVTVGNSFPPPSVEEGDDIYIEKVTEEKFRVSFCDLKYNSQSGTTFKIKGEFSTD